MALPVSRWVLSNPVLFSSLAYFATINTLTAFLISYDKTQAIKGGPRVSERTIITTALLGGFPSGYLAMKAYHHKTRKQSFLYPFHIASVVSAIAITGIVTLYYRNPRFISLWIRRVYRSL